MSRQQAVEIVAARTAGAMLAESLVKSRTTPLLLGGLGLAAVAIVVGIVLGGIAAVLVVLGLLVFAATAVVLLLRVAALAAIRRFVGGRDYAVARPIVLRHTDRFRERRDTLPLARLTAVRLLLLARRPSELRGQVVASGEAIVTAVPELVADLRQSLPREP